MAKLVRKAGQKSLKSQGAGYSTTNRKGETTFYKSSKDVPGFNDTNQSRSEMSRGNAPISRFDSAGNTITSDQLKPVTPVPLATPAPVDGLYGQTNANSAALAAMSGGTYDTKTNQIVSAPTPTPAPADNNKAILDAYLNANAGIQAPSATNNLKEMERMLRPKQNLVNSLSGQLNTITANRDAEMLRLEGQGRGVTESIIGGQQAQISREAAIQAMPIQAQLAIAQDDLESARTYAGQYFQAKMQDETNIYNQKKENNRLVFEFLNAAEQRRIAANEKALDREYAEKQATSKTAESIAMQAIEFGQSSLATKVMGLDTKSPTYAQDVRNAMAQLRKPAAPVSSSSSTNAVVTTDGRELVKVTPKEIQDLNDTQIAKNSLVALADSMIASIEKKGTQVLWGKEAGARDSAKTNLLLAMKNLEKTGALDKGTIDVLAGTIPGNTFFATEAAQIAALKGLRDTVTGKVDEYVSSYRGTTAEIDPRTARIYQSVAPSNFADDDLMDIESLFSSSVSSPASFY